MHVARSSKYSAEFRSDAIALWRTSVGRRTFWDVAADLNVNPETLRTWVRDADVRPAASGASQDTEAELPRLRAENARLAKAEKEWQLEREILPRQVVQHAAMFVGGERFCMMVFSGEQALEVVHRWSRDFRTCSSGFESPTRCRQLCGLTCTRSGHLVGQEGAWSPRPVSRGSRYYFELGAPQ
ncbi:hypothetical protein DRB96_29630 [Streptomyces sp. ICC1]|nr:hypothetical protein DRB89_29060 [Streptomyces sp. ICC4]AWZ15725.1 hypothetical protein DRB96_29630 [Streptomyces sp. ICC1]